MSNNYPEPPRTQWAELAVLSEASDPEDYRDIHGAVIDDENFRQLQKQVIVPFDTYADFPSEGPFDGAKAEAKDSNVVFRWDETAGDWIALNTGTSENPVPGTSHYESLKAADATINGDGSDGVSDDLLQFAFDNTTNFSDSHQQNDVSTSAVVVAEFPSNNAAMAVLVTGIDPSFNRFTDLVLIGDAQDPSVIGSVSAGSPSSRSYGLTSDGLELAMGSDTYDVRTRTLGVGGVTA